MHYTVESPRFGRFAATGDFMLPVRIQEVRALGSLAQVSTSDTFADAAVESAKTPFRVIKNLVTEPRETLEGAAEGTEKAAKKAGSWLSGDHRTRAESEDSAFGEAVGFSRCKRKLAHHLGVDVYSSNERLQDELDRVCRATVSGGLSVSALMAALPIPPVLELTRRTTGFADSMSSLLATKSGGDLYKLNRDILRGMGMPDALTEPFLNDPQLSPRHKTFIVAAMRDLRGVAGLEAFVAAGRAVDSEEGAVRLQRVAELARGYHRNVAPLREVARVDGEILLRSEDDTIAIVLPADRLLWTPATLALVETVAGFAPPEAAVDRREIWITGEFSARARDNLSDRDLDLQEHAADRLEGNSQGEGSR